MSSGYPEVQSLAIVLIEKIQTSQSNYIPSPSAIRHLLCCSFDRPISGHNFIIFDYNEIITSLRLEYVTELFLLSSIQ